MQSQRDPACSVVIPTRHPELTRELTRALDSVDRQLLDDVEVIVVIDGASASDAHSLTRAIEDSFSSLQVKVRAHQNNEGPGGARNLGIFESRGTYIAFLDDDDEWLPGKLRAQSEAMRRLGLEASCTAYLEHSTSHVDRYMSALKVAWQDSRTLARDCRIATPTVMVDRAFLMEHQLLFPENKRIEEDVDLWVRISEQTNWFYLPIASTRVYRRRDSAAQLSLDQSLGQRRYPTVHLVRYRFGRLLYEFLDGAARMIWREGPIVTKRRSAENQQVEASE